VNAIQDREETLEAGNAQQGCNLLQHPKNRGSDYWRLAESTWLDRFHREVM
jgi:hypothetical protein